MSRPRTKLTPQVNAFFTLLRVTLVENASAQQVANNSKLDLAGNAIAVFHERMALERKSMTR